LQGAFRSGPVFTVSASSAFPAPWAALPVGSTVLVIAAGTGGTARGLWPLTNRVMTYIGDRSYSLYLWHFPVIVFASSLLPPTGRYRLLTLALAATLAVVSYRFVEQPFRRPAAGPAGARRSTRTIRTAVAAGVVGFFVVAATVGWSMHTPAPAPAAGAAATAESDGTPRGDLQAAMRASLNLDSWPATSPALEDLGRSALAPEWMADGCLDEEEGADPDWRANGLRCLYGSASAPHHAILLGDSVGISWMPAVRAALGKDWSIQVLAMQQCPIADVDVLQGNGSPHATCDEFRAWAASEVERQHPDLLILSSYYQTLLQPAQPVSPEEQRIGWRQGLSSALGKLAPHAEQTVLLASPPNGSDVLECMTAFNAPRDCGSSPWDYYTEITDIEQSAVGDVGDSHLRYQPTAGWFCTDEGICPPIIGGRVVRADSIHLTAAFSGSLAAVLRDTLLPGR
jgi:hypothetical protein